MFLPSRRALGRATPKHCPHLRFSFDSRSKNDFRFLLMVVCTHPTDFQKWKARTMAFGASLRLGHNLNNERTRIVFASLYKPCPAFSLFSHHLRIPPVILLPSPVFLFFLRAGQEPRRQVLDDHHSFPRIFSITSYLFDSKNPIRNVFQSHFSRVHAGSFCCPCPSPICTYLPSAS